MKRALLIVDMQNDFMPWGSLPVPNADRIIPYINELMEEFEIVIATQDFHPEDHVSFVSNHPGKKIGDEVDGQRLWKEHCVQGTQGAELVANLDLKRVNLILRKGMNPLCDSYSAFFDVQGNSTGLSGYLEALQVQSLHVVGVATDVCVYFSVLDAIKLGFLVSVHKEGCQGLQEADQSLFKMQTQEAVLC